jgi:hypothetical protein
MASVAVMAVTFWVAPKLASAAFLNVTVFALLCVDPVNAV